MDHFVVVGAGQAGQSLVTKLRSEGFEGAITLIGQEPDPPYERPPLSKDYLLGEMALERLYLRPVQFYADNDITLRTGVRVDAIDPAAKTVKLGDEAIAYDKLAVTTGSVPRRLPAAIGGDLGGVYTVRTLADVDAMAPEFAQGRRVLVVGGGYIGLEAAAVAAKKGLKVTVVEMTERILQRVAAPETSDHIRAMHQSHGVDIREGVGLVKLTGETRVDGAQLSDSTTLAVDFVVVGVGILPDTSLAEAAGLAIENGIRVDEFSRSSEPDIFAAGDCASFPYKGGRIRLESVGNAIDQGENAALNMMGRQQPYIAQPWFWSDQYDLRLQIAGLNMGYDNIVTRRRSEVSVSFWYFSDDELLAVDAMNDSRSYMVARRMIAAGINPDKAAIADPATNLKALLKG